MKTQCISIKIDKSYKEKMGFIKHSLETIQDLKVTDIAEIAIRILYAKEKAKRIENEQ